jgi:ferritin-like metal-binding protein YciE
MADPTIGSIKLAQYLNEAYGKEKELETALQAHIQMTTAKPYKKRLQDHLKETKAHAREVERRIKKLGGKAEIAPAPGPELVTEAATAITSAASKAVAAAQGPLHAIRGTGEAEKMLKNAKTEYHNEFEEIAGYTAIEALAEELGDKETAKLARQIRRDEERMAKFLERQIPQLVKAVAREEIPSAERKKPRRSSSRRSSSASSTRKSSARKSTSRKSSAQGSSRKGSTRKASSRSASTRSSSSRSGSSRSGSSRRKSSSRS